MKKILEYLKSFLISLIIVLVLLNFFIMPCVVSGSSMYPTLEDGEYGISSIITRKIGTIERYDIVVVKVDDEYIVKRVIGLPNETIYCVDDVIYIDGMPIEQEFLNTDYRQEYTTFTKDFSQVEIGEDEYFLMGDNRPRSSDSRYYGSFKKEDIRSIGFFCIYPFRKIGFKK